MYSDDVQARGSEDAMSVLRGRADVFSVHTYFGSSIFSCRTIEMQVYVCSELSKGQLISKADWRAIDSPKKRMDEFVCLLFYSSWQTNQIRPFVFWENLQLANLLFDII